MNADQAKFLVEYFARMIETEVPTTAKVIAAVPEDRKDYKPDEKSRSAWDLAFRFRVEPKRSRLACA